MNTEVDLSLSWQVKFGRTKGMGLERHMVLEEKTWRGKKRAWPGNTLEGDVSDVIALDQLTSPFSPRKATRMSP